MLNNYLEKVYAGLIGKAVGVRLGAPVEPDSWTYERIERVFGEITDYVKEFTNFAADDDTNGPFIVTRALLDYATNRQMTPEDCANVYLNYVREGVGFFWWGGYGVASAHTAYLNLKGGIPAPQCGSAAQNGIVLAEQIGGQIFIDPFGLIFPGQPTKAAEYARICSSVTHDKNGLEGACFVAACVAKAFVTTNVDAIIDAGLAEVTPGSRYAEVVQAVRAFHKQHPNDWRVCRQMLADEWGYDKYPGACHVIPNTGICILALLYCNGDFNRSVEIATMCSWDTDCTAGIVGSIMGVACGLDGIRNNYRKPINDGLVLSTISGSMNIVDIPAWAKELAALGYRLAGEPIPETVGYMGKDIHFDFELPGATHNMRISHPYYLTLQQTTEKSFAGKGSLRIYFDRLARERSSKLFYKPFYRRADFSDERYMPVFSPTAYSGQTVSMQLLAERWTGEGLFIQPYVRNSTTGQDIKIAGQFLRKEEWTEIKFTIPDLDGAMVDEVGIMIEGDTPSTKGTDLGALYLDDFSITGKACYTIDIKKQKKELASITPFSHNHGAWILYQGTMHATAETHAEAMTGNYYTTDVCVTGKVTPAIGNSHLVSARVQGALRGYYAGLNTEGTAAILCNDNGLQVLATAPFAWETDRCYDITLRAQGDKLSLLINGATVVETSDSRFAYGMVGYAKFARGRTYFGNLSVEEL